MIGQKTPEVNKTYIGTMIGKDERIFCIVRHKPINLRLHRWPKVRSPNPWEDRPGKPCDIDLSINGIGILEVANFEHHIHCGIFNT